MTFGEEYFKAFRYSQRKNLIKRYVLEVLKWGSKVSNVNLLNGRGKTALDAGCAYGYALEVLKSLNYNVFGMDISKYSIKKAKKNCECDFIVCDVERELPFKSETFDLVVCLEVLEHLAKPFQAIRNIFDSCKDVMIYTTPNRVVEKPIKKFLRDFDKTHISVKTPLEWEKIMRRKLQFDFIKVETFFDVNLRVADKILFFKSFKIPYFGLDTRILIKKPSHR